MGLDEEARLIGAARDLGYTVFGAVGRKFADGDETRLTDDTLDIEVTIRESASNSQPGRGRCTGRDTCCAR